MPPLYLVCLAIVAGDALGNFGLFVPIAIAGALALLAAACFVAARAGLGTALAVAAIAAAATAPVRYLLASASCGIAGYADATELTIEGRLVRQPERSYGRLHLLVDVERAGPPAGAMAPASGLVRITTPGPDDYRIGQELRATARIRYPRNYGNPGEFDYQAYMARQGIVATMFVAGANPGAGGRPPAAAVTVVDQAAHRSRVEAARRHIARFIDANLGYPESEEMRALVIGDRGGIGEGLREEFALTGMAHLLVISGLHLGFVAAAAFALVRLILSLFARLMIRGWANKIAALAAAAAVLCYSTLAGHHVSTVRALVMVLAYVTAVMLDRPREALASLALAAAVICLILPGSTADIGFQLSFASVLAIILGMEKYAGWWKRRLASFSVGPAPRLYLAAGAVGDYLAVSFYALLGTAPLTAFHFNQFSLVGLVANAVVVPIMGAGATVLGLGACALSLVFEPAARLVLFGAGRCLALGTWLAGWFEGWPGAWVRCFTPTLLELAMVYGLILLWLVRRQDRQHAAGESDRRAGALAASLPSAGDRSEAPVAAWAGWPAARSWRRMRMVCAATLLVALALDGGWWVYRRYLHSDLRVTFLSVGEGDAAAIEFPGGAVMLIDGGGSFSDSFDPGERIVAPFLWSQKIMRVDYLVLSHRDLDHFGGLIFIARNFGPRQFWSPRASSPDLKYRALLEALAAADVRQRFIDIATPLSSIGGVGLACLNPAPGAIRGRNNASLVLALRFGASSFLFTGDIEEQGELAMLASRPAIGATVLKVPHHGSATSSTRKLVESVHPSIAVVSLGYLNRYRFPSAQVIARYRAIGARVLRTDRVGAVIVDATRAGLKVETVKREL